MAVTVTEDIINSTSRELRDLDGIRRQNPDTGATSSASMIANYTNRIFGAPFQLLPSVDMRASTINKYLGHEYLRNFVLNSPILSIRPGMPLFTGNDDPTSLKAFVKRLGGVVNEGGEFWSSALGLAAQSTIFRSTNIQTRMYNFRETYNAYIQYVNYACRGVAHLMKLTDSKGGFEEFPHGAHVCTGSDLEYKDFDYFNWANYRMLVTSHQENNRDYAIRIAENLFYDNAVKVLGNAGGTLSSIGSFFSNLFTGHIADAWNGEDVVNGSDPAGEDNWWESMKQGFSNIFNVPETAINTEEWIKEHELDPENDSIQNVVDNKIKAVQFMVEPTSFQEGYSNETGQSFIETKMDEIGDIGAEIGWITNSDPSNTLLSQTLGALGGVTDAAFSMIEGLMQNTTGGFVANLFNGAFRAIKGQKMIYPDIYRSSQVNSSYHFEMTLMSPYGDAYNYYMNIVVPMIHLLCLTAPRMVTANSVSAPFIVQAYIPGMMSVQMGIVKNLQMEKNPDSKLVTKDGFPTSVKVSLDIHELYNAMSISTAIDPSTYCYNETLNDYMACMAGLIPSNSVINQLTLFSMGNTENYIKSGEFIGDILSPWIESMENKFGSARIFK